MLIPDLTHRRREHEWMDAPDAEAGELERSLRFIRRVNALVGYTRQTISHLERFSRGWRRGERITILDLGTGSADVPMAILKWGEMRGWDLRIVGLDLHAGTARIAKAQAKHAKLSIVCADARGVPFEAGSFDYAMTSMFLHHLDEADAVRVMGEMGRVARRGVILSDLLRSRRAYVWISLFTLGAGAMVRHDARVSVGQAFCEDEILKLRDRAGIGFAEFHRHFGHRFVLAGEREWV